MVKIKKEAIILKPADLKPSSKEFEIISTINPAAIRLPNRDILLYVRVVEKLIKDADKNYVYSPRMNGKNKFKCVLDKFPIKLIKEKNPLDFVFQDGTKRLTYISCLRKIILDPTGLKVKYIEQKPSFFGINNDSEFGIEDPRITKIKGEYVMTYVTLSKYGDVSVSYALSKNLKKWKRMGVMFQEQNKDAIIFPEKIKDHYVAMNRPEGNFQFSLPHMWLSYSRDLRHWGHPTPLVLSKSKIGWDSGRVGVGPPPIKTKKGWLVLYHAVREKENKTSLPNRLIEKTFGLSNIITLYNVGAVLLKLENPSEILMKTKEPLFSPTKAYEKGIIEKKDVIFPTGMLWSNNKMKELLIYSGAGDIMTEVKEVSLDEIMKSLRKCSYQVPRQI